MRRIKNRMVICSCLFLLADPVLHAIFTCAVRSAACLPGAPWQCSGALLLKSNSVHCRERAVHARELGWFQLRWESDRALGRCGFEVTCEWLELQSGLTRASEGPGQSTNLGTEE